MLKSKMIFPVLAASIPLSLFFQSGVINICMVAFLLFCLYDARFPILDSFKSNRIIALLPLLFILYVCGLLITTQLNDGLTIVARKIPFLLLPIAFIVVNRKITNREFHIILLTLLLSCLAVSVFCYVRAIINIVQNHTIIYPNEVYKLYYFSYTPLTEPFEPIYLSLFSNLAFLIALQSPLIKNTTLKYFIAAYLGLFIILIAAKSGIVSFVIILFILVIRRQNKKIVSYVSLLLLIPLFIFATLKFPFLKERFITSLTFNYAEENGAVWNSNTLRLAIWSSAVEAIKKKPLLGYGTGVGQVALEQAYLDKGFVFGLYYKNHTEWNIPQYVAHNEFLSTALDLGLVGLSVLVLIFGFGFFYAVKSKDNLAIGFMVIIFITCCVESMLLRQKGLVFFSFFYSLIFWHYNAQKDQ